MSNKKKSISIKDINNNLNNEFLLDKPLIVDAIYILDRYSNIYRIYEKYSKFYLKNLFQDCLIILEIIGFLVESHETKGNIDQEETFIENIKIFPSFSNKIKNVILEYEFIMKNIEEINSQIETINNNANKEILEYINILKNKISSLENEFKEILKTLKLLDKQVQYCILHSKNINNYKLLLNDFKNIKIKIEKTIW